MLIVVAHAIKHAYNEKWTSRDGKCMHSPYKSRLRPSPSQKLVLMNCCRAANNSDIYLGFEYMETDLHNVIKKGILKDIHKKYIMYQLFKAVKYIHSGNVIHRDLKPSNILLDIMCRYCCHCCGTVVSSVSPGARSPILDWRAL
jgi:serine/threonine protein kinase